MFIAIQLLLKLNSCKANSNYVSCSLVLCMQALNRKKLAPINKNQRKEVFDIELVTQRSSHECQNYIFYYLHIQREIIPKNTAQLMTKLIFRYLSRRPRLASGSGEKFYRFLFQAIMHTKQQKIKK